MEEYNLILVSTVPGAIYTFFTLVKLGRFNFTGVFLLVTLFIGSGLDIVSGSVKAMFIYGAVYQFILAAVFLASLAIGRPLALTFALDLAELFGHSREGSRKLYSQTALMPFLHIITIIFVVKHLILGLAKWFVITYCYNNELNKLIIGYDHYLFYERLLSWGIGGSIAFVWFLFMRKVNDIVKNANKE